MSPASPPDPNPGGVGRPRPTSEPATESTSEPAPLPERDHLRRLRATFEHDPIYFLTCCTACRRPILTLPAVAEIMLAAWRDSPEFHGWVVGRHVIMPDHVHFFARARADSKPLSGFMRDWKKWTAKKISAATGDAPPIWQPEFFDHVLRSASSYSEKWDYVRNNPVRAGLAASPETWPFAGEGEDLKF